MARVNTASRECVNSAKMSALVAVVVEEENAAPQFMMVHVARGVFVNHVKNLLLQLKSAIMLLTVKMANAANLLFAFPFPISQSHSSRPRPQDQEFVVTAIALRIGNV